jgi:effector-binding domain-containing protein
MSKYDVMLKKIEAMRVTTMRDIVPTPPDQGSMWDELMSYLNQNKVRMNGTPVAIYHDPEAKGTRLGCRGAMPIADDLTGDNRIKIHNLPVVETMACMVHTGSFATSGLTRTVIKSLDQAES